MIDDEATLLSEPDGYPIELDGVPLGERGFEVFADGATPRALAPVRAASHRRAGAVWRLDGLHRYRLLSRGQQP